MNKLNKYTSTGVKFMRHKEAIELCRESGMATPISLQVAPTSKCNLKCSFCSNVNRTTHESLDPEKLCGFIRELSYRGLKTVEWTGGGDPTMYEHIRDLILFTKGLGLEQGLITNGILLGKVLSQNALDSLSWVRISMNCLDYIPTGFKIPKIKGTLGFSVVIHKSLKSTFWHDLDEYVKEYKPAYVRVVPNCQTTKEQQEVNNKEFPKYVETLGKPYFYQPKVFEKPERCWWGYFKPFLLHDGYVYPCSSVVLNEDSERSFHSKYRWYHMDEAVEQMYGTEMKHFPTESCTHCVFTDQNNMVDPLIHPCEMENFI